MSERIQQKAQLQHVHFQPVTGFLQYGRDPDGESRPSSDDDDERPSSGDRSDDRPTSDRSADEGDIKSWEDPEKGWSR